MDFLSRQSAPIHDTLWKQIDEAVVGVARNVLTGRRVLPMMGPLGAGVDSIHIDNIKAHQEEIGEGFITTAGRSLVEIPTLFEDFTLLAREMAASEKSGYPLDLSAVLTAAQALALREDRLIFLGHERLGYEGLLSARGVGDIAKADWSTGENAFANVAAAIEQLVSAGVFGNYTLVVSPNLYMQMQRLQPGTGLMEIDRVTKLVGGNLLKSPVLGRDQAVLLCAQPQNMDLVVGQDMAAAYLEQRNLNHEFRLLETVLLRLKNPQAVVVFR